MYTTKEIQTAMTPDSALDALRQGNERFLQGSSAGRDLLQQVQATSGGQHPFATILSCMDSRTSAELIFDQGIGDIFSIRIAGNILNDDILGSMEFATKVVGTKVVMVLGHTACGAIKGACDSVELGALTGLLNKVKPAIDAAGGSGGDNNGKNNDFVNRVTEAHVRHVMQEIPKQSPIIRELVESGAVRVAGGVYNIESGKVEFFS